MTTLDAGRAAYRAGDYRHALDVLLPLTRKGVVEAQRYAGLAHIADENPGRSVAEAVHWLGQAADGRDAPAAYELGRILKHGDDGLKSDKSEATRYFQAALDLSEPEADAGSAEHQFVLGLMYWNGDGVRRNAKRGLRWMRLAAEQGDPDHQAMLANALWWAPDSIAGMDEAVAWTTRVAEKGHVGAQYHLAANYAVGDDIEQDFRKAAKWYRRAAKQGHAEAIYNLGCMHLDGEGMPRDVAKGIALLDRAADLGFTDAMGVLGLIHSRGLRDQPVDADLAARHFLRAIRSGSVRAPRDLAIEILEGYIPEEAVTAALLQLASDDGVVQAEDMLATRRPEGSAPPASGD